MTKQAQVNVKCHECNTDLICPNCNKTQKMGTKFSLWFRKEDEIESELGYVLTDIDFVWRNRIEGWFIFIEEKVKGHRELEYPQMKTYEILDELLRDSYQYRGFYKIVFENLSPDDSEWIEINDIRCTKEDLLQLLKTGHFSIW